MIYGIYNGVVLDNTDFFSTGLIKVRIFNWYGAARTDKDNKPIAIDDLSTNPDMIKEGDYTTPDGQPATGPTQDFKCRILTSIGGGKNYGMFHLPQVNEKGVVAFLDNDFYKPIWMGGYFEPLQDLSQAPNYVIEQIPVPNDDITGTLNNAGYLPKQKPAGDPNAIVIRTKSTSLSPQGSSYNASDLDWSAQVSENLVLIGSDQMRLRHYSNFYKNYEEVLMNQSVADSAPLITTTVNNGQEDYSTIVSQSATSFSVTIKGPKGNFTWTVTGGDTGINLIDQFGNKILGDKNGLQIDTSNNSGSKVIIVSDKDLNVTSNNGSIIVAANNNVQIQGTGDNLVRYSYLKNIIDKIMNHTHIVSGSSGPTSTPMDSFGAPPLSTVTQQDENNAKVPTVTTSS